MKPKSRIRFDLSALKDLAGDKTFARGAPYHRDGLVTILSLRPERVVAQVSGTEDYRTELTGNGTVIDGNCSCRAFEDYGFCKHMVATALAANAAGESGPAEDVDPLSRIRDHLKTKGIDALVEMIVDLAERDPSLFRKLDLAAATLKGDRKALEVRLRKAIDGATRNRGFIDYRAAADWAAGVDEALDSLGELASGAQAGLALSLAEHAIKRIERAIEAIDDSDGHGGALLERARDIHLAACNAARPDPVELARHLFDRETHGIYDTFDGAVGLYADVLGEQGLAEYSRLADAAWSKIPARMGRRQAAMDDTSVDGHRLASILDFFAERDGDVEARIAIRAKDLSSPWNYLQLAQFCLDQGREEEALRRAEEGLWIFEDEKRDEGLAVFAAELLLKKGRKSEAEAHFWRIFEKAPSLEMYKRLAKLGGTAARERAVAVLKARSAAGKSTAWDHPGDLLIRVLMHDKAFDAAWAAVREHGASSYAREDLAKASEATHPGDALAVYVESIEQHANSGRYEEAAKLIARLAALQGAAEQAAYVAALRQRHRRKRNFMKLLG